MGYSGTINTSTYKERAAFKAPSNRLPNPNTQKAEEEMMSTEVLEYPFQDKSRVKVPVPKTTLTLLNVILTIFHAALATVTLIFGNIDLMVPVYTSELSFVSENGEWDIVPVSKKMEVGLPFTWLTAIFFILSALFHLLNCSFLRNLYLSELEVCRSPLRWVEYSLSAPVMIVLISYTLGIRDATTLFFNAIFVAITMPFGYWTETIAKPLSSDEWNTTLFFRIYPWIIGHIPQTAAWTSIVVAFYGTPGIVENAPWFVPLILWAELALFYSFGLASLISQILSPRLFYVGEILFQALSLVSKGVLGGILIVNVLMLSSFDEIYSD
jgi:hypothetical protein